MRTTSFTKLLAVELCKRVFALCVRNPLACWLAFCGMIFGKVALGQEAALAPDDLKFTRSMFSNSRVIAEVKIGDQDSPTEQYRYELTPDSEKITQTIPAPSKPLVFTRAKGKPWTSVDAKGKAGSPVDAEREKQLDISVSIAMGPFDLPTPHDQSQGGMVWKFIERIEGKGVAGFTYEQTRERPRPDGVYPRYTFIKYPSDQDGELMLTRAWGNLVSGDGQRFPYAIEFRYERRAFDNQPLEVWVIGEVFTKKNVLYFRLDRPVAGNPLRDIVLLGSVREAANVFLPSFMRAAEQKQTLRLYGVLEACDRKLPGHKETLPNVEFIASKMHLPSDPDELPPDQKIIVGPNDSVPGYKVTPVEKSKK